MSQNWLSNNLLAKNSNLSSVSPMNVLESKNSKTDSSNAFSNLLSAKLNSSQSSQSLKVPSKSTDLGELRAAKKLESPVLKSKQSFSKEETSAAKTEELSTTDSEQKVKNSKTEAPTSDNTSTQNESEKTTVEKTEIVEGEIPKEEATNNLDNLLQLISTLMESTPELKESLTEVKTQLENLIQSIGNQNGLNLETLEIPKVVEAVNKLSELLENSKETLSDSQLEAIEPVKAALSKVTEILSSASTFEEIVKDFGKPLAPIVKETGSMNVEMSKTPQVQTTQNEVQPTQVPEGQANKENSGQSADSEKQETSKGKEKTTLDVKVQSESKNSHETKNATTNFAQEMTAKMDSSTVAFSKTDIAQAGKTTLQQNIMDQIMNSPRLQIKQTELGTSMTMKLNPEVLGNVEIKLEIVKNVLQAEINVENLIVKGAIEANLSDLKNALSDKGYDVEALNVSVSKDAQEQRGQQQRQNEQAGRYFMEEEQEASNKGFSLSALDSNATIDYLG